MEPIQVQLQLLKELYHAANEEDLRDPSHPLWESYDCFYALTGRAVIQSRTA
jgi:hypothetical protein